MVAPVNPQMVTSIPLPRNPQIGTSTPIPPHNDKPFECICSPMTSEGRRPDSRRVALSSEPYVVEASYVEGGGGDSHTSSSLIYVEPEKQGSTERIYGSWNRTQVTVLDDSNWNRHYDSNPETHSFSFRPLFHTQSPHLARSVRRRERSAV